MTLCTRNPKAMTKMGTHLFLCKEGQSRGYKKGKEGSLHRIETVGEPGGVDGPAVLYGTKESALPFLAKRHIILTSYAGYLIHAITESVDEKPHFVLRQIRDRKGLVAVTAVDDDEDEGDE